VLVALAESMLAGGRHLAHVDVLRDDRAGRVLRTVAEVPAPGTASQLLPRFVARQLQGVVWRALRTLPKGDGEVLLRADSGVYSVPFLIWRRRHRLRFCVVVPRYRTMWEARRHLAPNSWRPALEMVRAEVAEMPFMPAGWKG
jgi:hypothetical protein